MADFDRLQTFNRWASRSGQGLRVGNRTLRKYDLYFPELQFVDGATFVPWETIEKKLTTGYRSLEYVVSHHFHGERLVVGEDGEKTLTMTPNFRCGRNDKIYLRLEHAWNDDRMKFVLRKLEKDWDTQTKHEIDTNTPMVEYAKFDGDKVRGLCYKLPKPQTCGVYVLHCGPLHRFNNENYDGHMFILKVGSSKGITERVAFHNSPTNPMKAKTGKVEFLFCLELQVNEYKAAEILLLSKLTELGFAHLTTSESHGRSFEHFAFSKQTLPLIHDVVCAVRFAYPVPRERKTKAGEIT